MHNFTKLSLSQKLNLLILSVLFIPIITLYISSSFIANDLMIREYETNTLNNLNLITKDISDFYDRIASASVFLSTDIEVTRIIEDNYIRKPDLTNTERSQNLSQINYLNELTNNLLTNTVGFPANISILTETDIIYTTHTNQNEELYDFLVSYKKYLNIQSRYVQWNQPMEDSLNFYNNSYYLNVVFQPIYSKNNKTVLGYIFIDFPEKVLVDMINSDLLDSDRILADHTYNIISSKNKQLINMNLNEVFPVEILNNKEEVLMSIDIDQRDMVVTYQTLPTSNWVILDLATESSIVGDVTDIQSKLVIFTLISILIFLLLSYKLIKNVTQPITELSSNMLNNSLVALGIDQSNTRNEVVILRESYKKMMCEINLLIKENAEKEEKKRVYELKALQAQLNPHFLFNTLNAIRWTIINKRYSNASTMLLSLSKLLRKTITITSPTITIKQEFQLLSDYMEILKKMYANEFSYEFELEMNLENYPIPKLLLQPLVENTIIHGFKGITADGKITIKAFYSSEIVKIQVIDNGIGFTTNPLEHSSSPSSNIGVANVNERIKLYYGTQYGLFFSRNKIKGTKAEIYLPKEM